MFPAVFAVEDRTRFLMHLLADLKNPDGRELGLRDRSAESPFDLSIAQSKVT